MYVSLHNCSAYSFGASLSQPAALARRAADLGMPAVALTDRGGLYAAVPFQQACREFGVRPILGVSLEVRAGPVDETENNGIRVTLLARDPTGYGNLCRLISRRHLNEKPIDEESLSNHSEGLICLVGRAESGTSHPRSRTATQKRADTEQQSRETWERLREVFGGRIYVELAIHQPGDARVARARARLADELGLPLAAVCESRCLRRSQLPTLQALSSIGALTLLEQPHPDKPDGTWHLRSSAEMARLFARRPDALQNTLRIAEQCDFLLDLSKNRFPAFRSEDGRDAMAHLRALGTAGCRRRYVEQPQQRGIGGKRPTLSEALQRLERELAVIEQVGYAEYFLVFHEIVEYCRSRGITTLARGSAADSLVCYALGVSHACPFRFDLPFDRFINPERAKFSKMADIDLDLPWDRRDEVIRWVYDRWGHDRVAMIGAANTFHARAAVAELGKVFGLPEHEVRRLTRLLPHVTSRDLPAAIARSPEARQMPVDEEPYRTILRMARDLEGLPRHWAMHPCGLVVSPEPLAELVPVQRSPKGLLVAQFDMDAIEALGFVKVDLLGQAGLSVLRDTVEEIARTEGRHIDLEADVDYSDETTWNMIATGHARGVHHIESPAMTNLIQQCNCRDINGLTTVVAIIRPGAANQGKKEAFARRYQGLEPPRYAHPALVPALEGTYGIMVFEEHILQAAVEFAGMNVGRADVLRRALNKEDRALVLEMKAEFYACARAKGRKEAEIDQVWPELQNFSGFMFNKAHSAEYAIEAFQGAWLKRRWPLHYLAAVLSNDRGFYAHSPTLPQILYVLEAMRLGGSFLPPCVNRSRERFSLEKRTKSDGRTTEYGAEDRPQIPSDRRDSPLPGRPAPLAIRLPLSHISGLSAEFIERHLSERQQAPFASLADFVDRCRPGEAEAQALLDAGALDVFDTPRPALFWQLRRLVGRRSPARVPVGQAGLWRRAADDRPDTPPLELTPPGPRQIAERETALLGFPITIDPLAFLGSDDAGNMIDWPRYTPVAALPQHVGQRVTVCGLMVADRIDRTTTGDLMKFVTLADRTGFLETFMFPKPYQRFGHLTAANPILAATGRVEAFENRNGVTLRVQSVAVPERTAAQNAT